QLWPALTVDYQVAEVPEVCRHGRKGHPEVVFCEDDSWKSQAFDLVIASNALQYVRCWKDTLAALAKVLRTGLWLTRVPIADKSPSFVVLQRAWSYGYRTESLGWCFNQEEFLATARRNGLRLVREFLVFTRDPTVSRAPENPHYKGFLFAKEASSH